MLIEPVRIAPRGRLWRLRVVVAVAAPLVILLAVVGASLLTDDHPTTAEARPSAVPASAAPVVGVPAASPAAAEAPPRRALGLPAHSVAAVLDDRRADRLGDRLIAIRGYLTVGPGVEGCLVDGDADGREVTAPFRCQRTAILRDTAEPPFSVAAGQLHWDVPRGYPYLHPTIFPGISLGPLDPPAGPSAATGVAATDWLLPRPVIVIGRFDDPRVADPRSNPRHPNEAFVIERLVWAEGRWQDRRLVRLTPWRGTDLDLRTSRAVAVEALPGSTVILSQNVVDATTLASLDPSASAAVGPRVGDADRLWYIRAMTREGPPVDTLADSGGPRRLGWVVLANDGTILASDRDG